MKDREFLWWLHERLVSVHGEKDNMDYMWKLRNIILDYDPDKVTPNIRSVRAEDMAEKVFGTDKD